MAPRYDIHFEGTPEANGRENFLFLSFGEEGSVAVHGLQMLVNHWAKCFLTPRGSDPCDLSYGTEFSHLIGSNLSVEDARDITLIAIDTCSEQVKAWQLRDDTLAPNERLASATLISFVGDNAGPGFHVTIDIKNRAGERRTTLLRSA